MASVPRTMRSKRLKRYLFVGPTGAGKSKIINCCYNRKIDPKSLSTPAEVGEPERLIGRTSSISNYVDQNERKVYVDTVGYGDARFQVDKESFLLFFRELVCYASIGYNWLFLVLRYERLTLDILDYVEMLEKLLGERALTRCTIVFTHCKIKGMDRNNCIAANQESQKLVGLLEQVHSVIFGDMDTFDDSDLTAEERSVVSRIQVHRRQCFMEQLLGRIDSTDDSVLRLNESRFHSHLTHFAQFVGYCLEKVFGKSNELSKRYRLATTLKQGIPVTIYYETCTICHELIIEIWDTQPTASITKCGHIFHYECLKKCLDRQKNCPICRSDLRTMPERILGSRIGLHPVDDTSENKTAISSTAVTATNVIIPPETPFEATSTAILRSSTPTGEAVGELISIEESAKD